MAPELLHDGNNCNDGGNSNDGDDGDNGGGGGVNSDSGDNSDSEVYRASAAGDVWSFAMTALVSFNYL